jgi:hypothetical protein
MSCHHSNSAKTAEPSGHDRVTHHCDGEAGNTAEVLADGATAIDKHSQPCPMNCCDQTTLKSRTALTSNLFFPGLIAFELANHAASVTFISAGFSSHTDRGPPLS